MELFTKNNLKELVTMEGDRYISIFMPTFKTVPDTRQNPIRFRNLVKEAERALEEGEIAEADKGRLLEPLINLAGDQMFWMQQSDGLALFRSEDFFAYYRLPVPFEETVTVSDRFSVKPLIPLVSGWEQFYVLAISLHDVKLFRCTRYTAMKIPIENAPQSLEEALQYDDFEEQLQFHTGTPRGAGKRPAIYHGQGAAADERRRKAEILRFFQQVDRGLRDVLKEEQAPMVLAGVEYLLPIYREANSYNYLMEHGIPGNPDHAATEDLRDQAWAIAEPLFSEDRNAAITRYERLSGTERVSAELEKIIPAAHFARVDTLFVARDRAVWGVFDEKSQNVRIDREKKAGNKDLLDLAAAHTILNRGAVFVVDADEVPGASPAAAIFRYPAEP
jgi:hypothetical protein